MSKYLYPAPFKTLTPEWDPLNDSFFSFSDEELEKNYFFTNLKKDIILDLFDNGLRLSPEADAAINTFTIKIRQQDYWFRLQDLKHLKAAKLPDDDSCNRGVNPYKLNLAKHELTIPAWLEPSRKHEFTTLTLQHKVGSLVYDLYKEAIEKYTKYRNELIKKVVDVDFRAGSPQCYYDLYLVAYELPEIRKFTISEFERILI